jgi:hypothetical protein
MLPFALLTGLILIIFYLIIQVFLLFIKLNMPEKVTYDAKWGKIPAPQVKNASASGSFRFTLDTIEGQAIEASETAKIFYMPSSYSDLSTEGKVYLMAKKIGFDTENVKYTKLSAREISFVDDKRNLTIDVTNYNFKYVYDFSSERSLFFGTRIPEQKEIEDKAREFLQSVNRYPTELAQGQTHIIYLYYNYISKQMSVKERPIEANVVEVDFFRPPIDGFEVVSPSYYNSQNSVILVFNQTDYKVLKAEVSFFEKSSEQVATYPLKKGSQAWSELQDNKGIIISAPAGKNNISIKKMFYAYLDPDIYQSYLQPVYVFLGDDNFVGYVPAVANEYLTE